MCIVYNVLQLMLRALETYFRWFVLFVSFYIAMISCIVRLEIAVALTLKISTILNLKNVQVEKNSLILTHYFLL